MPTLECGLIKVEEAPKLGEAIEAITADFQSMVLPGILASHACDKVIDYQRYHSLATWQILCLLSSKYFISVYTSRLVRCERQQPRLQCE